MKKLIRITTVPSSLRSLLRGQHRFMSQHFEVIGISGAGDALEEVRQNEGIRTQVVEMTRSITPLKDVSALWKLYRFFKKEKPFIVHTHTPKAGTLGMMAAKMAGVKHRLHTVAGLPLLETKGSKRALLDGVEKLTYNCATKVLPNSYGLEKIILENGYAKAEKLQVIGKGSSNGINTKHYDPSLFSELDKSKLRQQLHIQGDELVFIFIGRLVKDKGLNELISAFDSISKGKQPCKLLLIGSPENDLDPLFPETETIIKKNPHILPLGVQKDIRPYLAISDVLTFPSYREGFPNVVLEASCMELPCIVSNINGCNEIIEHNVNGLIVPVKDENALKSAMKKLLDQPEKRSEMSKISRQRIIDRYEQSFVWNELLKLYQSLD